MSVKGTREYQYKVVRHRPQWRFWLVLLVLVLLVSTGQTAYWLGFKRGMAGQEKALSDLAAIKTELAEAREAEAAARQRLENERLGAEVDRTALEDVRGEITELKETIAALDEENQFYRSLMAPSESQKGLTFGTVEIVDTERPRAYRYKVVMQQLATNHELLSGTLNFNVVGRQDGQVAVYSLNEISAEQDSANIKLRFKYFQNIEGTLVLPEGFDPERIELEARASQPQQTEVDKRFGWLVQEP